jgi:uncharacterized membrane protein
MTRLGRVITVVALAVILALGASAGDLKGILMDVACSANAIKAGREVVTAHTRECALKEPGVKSGYGVYTQDGKFLALDAAGNQMAQKALEASKKKDNLAVKISGKQTGELIEVKSLKII